MSLTDDQTAPRGPGRPPAGGTDQREHLLDLAIQGFADNGIAATSLRQLAESAGVTAAMLNYYFGTKEKLVESVVTERLMPAINSLKARLADSPPADSGELVTAIVDGMHAAITQHRWLPSLWVREVLSEGGQLRSVFIERIGPAFPVPLAERFAKGQADGELNSALDARLLFVSLIGLTMLPFAAEPIWRSVFDARDITAEDIRHHTLALLSHGVRA